MYLYVNTLIFSISTMVFANNQPYTIVEGKGIKSIAFVGDNISAVIAKLGKPDEYIDDPYSESYYCRYRKLGVEFTTNKDGKILYIILYCNTGDKETFHKTGLIWINPSSIFATFNGVTTKGLRLKDKLMPDDVYKIYGKPDVVIDKDIRKTEEKFKSSGKPFIADFKKAGYTINYPALNISFSTFNGIVEAFHVKDDIYWKKK